MNRARRRGTIHTGMITTGLLLCVLSGIAHYARSVIAQSPLIITDDYILSDSYRNSLHTDLANAVHTAGAAHTVAHGTDYAPVIKSMSIHYRLPCTGSMQYEVTPPIAYLNHVAALLNDGTLVPAELFAPEVISSLASVEVPHTMLEHDDVPQELLALAYTLNTPFHTRFTCSWVDKNTCYCHDTEHPHYTLVCMGSAVPCAQDLAAYEAVLNEHKSARATAHWMVDMRFKNQVIMYPDGGI